MPFKFLHYLSQKKKCFHHLKVYIISMTRQVILVDFNYINLNIKLNLYELFRLNIPFILLDT